MNCGIAGRTALVVGGSKGIGLQAAMMLAAEGARVAIVARTQKHIDRAVASIIANGGEATGVSADMSSPDGIESAVTEVRERLAPPAIVITQADFHVRGFFAEITRAEDFVDSYRTYTLSQVHMLRAVLPAMQEAGWGASCTSGPSRRRVAPDVDDRDGRGACTAPPSDVPRRDR
jgi:3-oxoacyl-[acyl-carrier protein] reductase